MLLISGPNQHRAGSSDKKTRSVLLLEGHHTVPKKSKSTLTSGFLIGHEKENAGMSGGNGDFGDSISKTNNNKAKPNNLSVAFFGTIKDHQNIVYMVFASVGIPLFIIVLCYFEVSENVYVGELYTWILPLFGLLCYPSSESFK